MLAYDTWGAVGTSGAYGGVSLGDWKRRLRQPVPAVVDLLGKSFRQLPENQSYPLAGLSVEVAVEKLGVAKVRQHLYGATTSTWAAACKDAGTTTQELEAAFQTAATK